MKPFTRAKICAILNSRQHYFPSLDCGWVRGSIEAMNWIAQQGHIVCTSCGVGTWELLLHLARERKVPQLIFVPGGSFHSRSGQLIQDYELDISQISFVPLESDDPLERDRHIMFFSDILIPVSIREKGSLQKLITDTKDKVIIDQFRTSYVKIAPRCKASPINNRLDYNTLETLNDKYLIHWTRKSIKPWPDEKPLHFYRSITSGATYPRDGFHTLLHIIESKTIIGSSFNIRGKIPVVCFSGLSPVNFIPLMRWRARFHNMSFEPYGIGVKKSLAQKAGITPVIYTEKAMHKRYPAEWQLQSMGKVTDWSKENEYRCRGNFSFATIAPDDLICICQHEKEKAIIEDRCDIPCVAINHE